MALMTGEPINPTTWTNMAGQLENLLPKCAAGLAVFVAFWLAAVVASGLIRRLGLSRRVDPDVTQLLAQSAKVGLVLFGLVSGLGTVGVNVSALVAGLGLTGLAIGLALKEVVSNAIAGALILVYKPFRRGDTVAVLTFQGRALEVNLRYTTLEAGGGRVFVPNMMLLTNVVAVGAEGMPPLAPPSVPPGPTPVKPTGDD
jgi:small conductance mechanosensitive channel